MLLRAFTTCQAHAEWPALFCRILRSSYEASSTLGAD